MLYEKQTNRRNTKFNKNRTITKKIKMPEKENPKLKDVNLSSTREFTEEYADYRKRMQENYYKIKYYLKGELFWDSLAKGTYRTNKR